MSTFYYEPTNLQLRCTALCDPKIVTPPSQTIMIPLMVVDERERIPKGRFYSSDSAATAVMSDSPIVPTKHCTLQRSKSLPISFKEKKRYFQTATHRINASTLLPSNSLTSRAVTNVDKPNSLACKRRYSERQDSRRWVYPHRDDYNRYLIPKTSQKQTTEAKDDDLVGLSFVDEATN
jgi:hypothetical protein